MAKFGSRYGRRHLSANANIRYRRVLSGYVYNAVWNHRYCDMCDRAWTSRIYGYANGLSETEDSAFFTRAMRLITYDRLLGKGWSK